MNAKGLNTIQQYPRKGLLYAYFDASADEIITNGVSGIFRTVPISTPYEHKAVAGLAFYFAYNILAIVEAFHTVKPYLYLRRQWRSLFSMTKRQISRLLIKKSHCLSTERTTPKLRELTKFYSLQ